MRLIWILCAAVGVAGCARTARTCCAPTSFSVVASFDGLDKLTAVHIENTLGRHGIRAFVEGSVGQSVSVTTRHRDRAESILARDSVEFRYPILFGAKPSPWGVESYDWRRIPVEGSVKQLAAGHALDGRWALRAALQPSISGIREFALGTVLTAAARAERRWRRRDGGVETAVMLALSWEGEGWVRGPDLVTVWREDGQVRTQFMGAAPAGLPAAARP